MSQLKRSKVDNLLAQVLRGLGVPIFAVHPADQRILTVNESAEELTGRSQEELTGLTIADLFAPQSQRKIQGLCEVAARGGSASVEEVDCQLIRRSGRPAPVNVRASLIMYRRQARLLFSMQDLTQMKRLEKNREKQIEEVSQIAKLADIGMLAAGVAHELNNPLMIVQGFAENIDLLLDKPAIRPEELKTQTREILLAVERMSRIINQMSRIVRSTEVRLETTTVRSLVENITRFIQHEFRQKEINVKVDISDTLNINCDATQIEQVVLNILSNAIHALTQIPADRQIRITATVISGIVELSIWNNGPAIPKHIQDKIMTPFFTTKEVGKGTGLGLSVSYGIMRAHGGNISFQSSQDSGTSFKLTFPSAIRHQETLIVDHGKKVILAINDQIVAGDLADKLHAFGSRILRARSGAEANMLMLQNKGVAAIFVDENLPDVAADQFARQTRQFEAKGPLIIVVAHRILDQAAKDRLMAYGVDAVLTSPINHNAFSALINRLMPPASPAKAA